MRTLADVRDEPIPDIGVIIVRMWWEAAGAGEVSLRARVTSTLNAAPNTPSAGASNREGILEAVRSAVEAFVASRPPGMGAAGG